MGRSGSSSSGEDQPAGARRDPASTCSEPGEVRLTHLAQINRALACQYREQVGPWVELLSILKPRS